MAGYVYKGTQAGEQDPWVINPPPLPKNPRPDKPRVPGLIWAATQNRWVPQIKHKGKTTYLGKYRPEEYDEAVQLLTAARQALKEQDPEWNQLKACGTHAAYQRHYRRGEPIDLACRRAEYEYVEQHRKAKAA